MIREKWLIEIERSIEMGGTDAGFKFSIKLDTKKVFLVLPNFVEKGLWREGRIAQKLFKIRQMSKSPPEMR